MNSPSKWKIQFSKTLIQHKNPQQQIFPVAGVI